MFNLCPFCSCSSAYFDNHNEQSRIVCSSCGASGPAFPEGQTPEDSWAAERKAFEAWQTRKTIDFLTLAPRVEMCYYCTSEDHANQVRELFLGLGWGKVSEGLNHNCYTINLNHGSPTICIEW
jgi:hypothetical protein